MFLPFELPAYYGEPSWHRADRVLDLGTGNGAYLEALRVRFPEKRYKGIDRNAALLARAEGSAAGEGIAFAVGDLLDLDETSPFVLARLVAQTVTPVEDFLESVAGCLPADGTFLSLEPNDATRLFHPAWQSLETLFERLTDRSRDDVPDRAVAATLQALAPRFGLDCVRSRDVMVPSTATGDGGRFWGFLDSLLTLCETAFEEPYDYDALRREMAARQSDPQSYGQFGFTQAVYRRTR